jgi:hypothetical protein
MNKLKENGFNIRYIHPNTLFISWIHWIPSYVRNELKKKTGIVINEFGKKIEENQEQSTNNLIDAVDANNFMLNKNTQDTLEKSKVPKKEYTPINSYKPSGNLIYDNEMLDRIGNKFS